MIPECDSAVQTGRARKPAQVFLIHPKRLPQLKGEGLFSTFLPRFGVKEWIRGLLLK